MSSRSGWFAPRFLGGSLALLVFMRGLYLLRFGWDPGWMNVTYLLRAKHWVMGAPVLAEEPPLTPLLLWGARILGFSSSGALAAVYLFMHLAMFLAILGLGWFLWPDASSRRRWSLSLTAALVPLLACETGRNNLGVLVGAALATSAISLTACAARLPQISFWRLALAAIAAFFAGTARMESLMTCVAGAGLLLAFGNRLDDLPRPRVAGATLALASAASYLVTAHYRGNAPSDYAFYTFYDGLPFLMYPKFTLSEYERYRASVGYFGSYEANHGSLFHALLSHPLYAIARVAAKSVDMLGVLLWPQSLTPIGVAAAVSGLRKTTRSSNWSRAWLLFAFLPALVVLLVPFSNPHYYLSIAAPLVLAIARGIDRWTASLSSIAAQKLAFASIAVMAALVGWVGRWEAASSRTINGASDWLEDRCRSGCLANVVPQSLERQAWVDLQKGAPIIRGHSRSEAAISGDYAREHERDYNFCERVKRARAGGYSGPVLYIDAKIKSYRAFDPDFDPEVRYQGQVDLAGAVEEKRFTQGDDQIIIYRLDQVRCLP
jgi:hypothetical protein